MFLKPTSSVPSTVQLLSVPEAGVPNTGAVNTGAVKVLLVSVSVDTKLTKVESAPDGSNIVLVTFALCGCDLSV